MKKNRLVIALTMLCASVAMTPAALAADTLTTNTCPTDGFSYGTGNNYSPCNAAVVTTDAGGELALRFHQTGQVAPASDSNGVYNFLLGTMPVSFDFLIDMINPINNSLGLVTIKNEGTGAIASYNPFTGFGSNDNTYFTAGIQNSARLNWFPVGFDANVNGLYSTTVQYDNHSVKAYAKIGDGLSVSAVPEPATWASMLIGFGAIGSVMRRSKKSRRLAFAA